MIMKNGEICWLHLCVGFFSCILIHNRYLSATRCPSSTLISWEYLVISGGSQRNSSSGMDQKYRPERCWGDAHVSRSSSLFSLRSHSNSQLQWRGFPPNDNAKEDGVRTPDVASTWRCERKRWFIFINQATAQHSNPHLLWEMYNHCPGCWVTN